MTLDLLSLLTVIVILSGIYALLALGLNLHLGFTGLINFGIVAYFAVGAYAYTILVQPPPTGFDEYKLGFGLPMWVGVLGAMGAAVLFALISAWPCLRLRGEYLALTTFAFAEVVGSLLTNAKEVTNGTLGFAGLSQPFVGMVQGRYYPQLLALLVAATVTLAFLLQRRLTNAPFGRNLLMIRDDEVAARLAGKNVRRYRLQAFVLGALTSGLAGVLYAWYTTFVSPAQFTADVTFVVWIALVLGGVGSNIGPIIGPAILISFQEVVRVLVTNPFIEARMGAIQLAVEGLLLIILLRAYPNGLAGAWAPRNDRRPGGGKLREPRVELVGSQNPAD